MRKLPYLCYFAIAPVFLNICSEDILFILNVEIFTQYWFTFGCIVSCL